ncbi:LysR family transcriptional regulator [Bordetella ansorpii]|uniref:LysR family transcriptional regulator n=1 Tax=Bordetella ansorpii TaxID=288768 RepID=A0A157SR85_9BORD|nr:LysR family transcriptional regulator [Bordetella ansorpii]SAI72416.1 LysR family transcriptional regulator [Bordetella ansorpii]
MKGSRNSLTSLRIFLEAARTLNFSRAAENLHLTQSAVSKHVGALEDRLGCPLFKRLPAGLRLTHAGALYLERVAAGMRLIDEADAMVAHPGSRVALNLAVSPSFAQFCLIPGLREFFDLHPEVRVNVRPRLLYARDRSERFDAEIQLHTGHVAGMSAQYLCGREMTLVAAPALLARTPIRTLDDLDRATLLKRAQRGYGWDEWKADIAPLWPGPAPSAPEYEGFSVLLPAVLAGLGVAVVPLCMVLEPLRSGALVRPLGEVVEGRYGYFLLQPRPNVGGPYAEALCGWVSDRAGRLNDQVRALR